MNLLDLAINGYKPTPIELDAFATVKKNQRNQMKVTTGPTFQNMELVTNITDPALIETVQVELNGTMIVDVTGTELKMIEGYTKRNRANGRYVIPFCRTEAKTLDGARTGELVTLPTDNITVYVKLGDTGVTEPEMRARALVTPAQSVRVFIPKLDSVNINASTTGMNRFSWDNRSPNLHIRRLHFYRADMTRLEVWRDDLRVFEASDVDNAADLAEGNDNAPQAGIFHFDPAHMGYQLQGLFATIARKSLEFRYWAGSTGNVKVLRETIEQVAPIGQAA
ncbi:major capsid protein P2 [Bowmanella yangjiangensis]|uniref:Viral coat protein P2 N-terminal domain-containing protein n=1 Tax=Bowmanella yangjiangensis TaxID=2811230 RepID=A0ABS3CTS5_9ALTE|nr:major capsid protein P2 [Bowmanella yangjiangensis]MBN7820523.1 hypothetical protein [Bowmanella yangjiangensis]